MKKIFCLFFILTTLYLNAQINSDSFVRLNVELNGILKADNRIVIYGSNGCLMFSDEKAKSWEQISIGDSLYIVNLNYNNKKLNGIVYSNDNHIFYELSFDNTSRTSILNRLNIPLVGFRKFQQVNNMMFFASHTEIYSFNQITKVVSKEYSDTTLKFNNFVAINNYLLMATITDTLLRFNTLSKIIERVPSKGLISNANSLINYNNSLYCISNNKFLKSIDNGVTWDSLSLLQNCVLSISNDNILYATTTNTFENFIQKLTNDGLTFNFNEKSIIKFDKYIKQFQISNIFYIDSNTTLAIGFNKLIIKSIDKLKSWTLISNYSREAYDIKIKFFDKFYGISYNNYNQFFKTFDGGATWLPINDTPTIPLGFGTNFVGDNSIKRNGLFLYLQRDYKKEYESKIAYSTDTCKTFKYNTIDFSGFSGFSNLFETIDSIYFVMWSYFGNNTISKLYTINQSYKNTNIKQFDSLKIFKIYKNNENNLEMICNEYRYRIHNEIGGNAPYLFDSTKVIIKESFDKGETWVDKHIIQSTNHHKLKDQISLSDRSLFLSSKSEYIPAVNDSNTYLYEIKNGVVSLIHTFADFNVISIVDYNGKLYYGSDRKIYYQDANFEWKSNNISSYIGGKYYPTFDFGNVLYVATTSTQLYDKDFTNIYRFTDESPISDVEAQIEEMTDLVTLSPAPLPANTFTKIGVIWSPIYKFYLSNIEVFDIYGIKVKSNLKTSLREFDTFRGELTLQTEDLPEGVFFVKISHGITTKYVKILVSH
ncbi:MAG: hypothetical protein NTW25_12420 [Candidatus Kapabacteria bacterium]|nr:hypothetical protein [Candidatus Kapabacteria bacterium]